MKNIILFLAFSLGLATQSYAAEKIYLVNSASTTGTFNAIMTAYSKDLSPVYDVEYVQGSNCQKAKSTVENLVKNKQAVAVLWQSLDSAEHLDMQDGVCVMLPTAANFVRADIKYSIFYSIKDKNSTVALLSKDVKKVGYSGQSAKHWLEQFAEHHSLNWTLIRYRNSTDIYLGVLNKEVDFAYSNTAATFWKNDEKLTGMYSLNPKGDNTVPALRTVSDFSKASAAQADMLLYYGPDIAAFKNAIRKIHSVDDSSIVQFYKLGGSSYTDTLTMTDPTAISAVKSSISNWQQRRGN
jgi:hypothetical protein